MPIWVVSSAEHAEFTIAIPVEYYQTAPDVDSNCRGRGDAYYVWKSDAKGCKIAQNLGQVAITASRRATIPQFVRSRMKPGILNYESMFYEKTFKEGLDRDKDARMGCVFCGAVSSAERGDQNSMPSENGWAWSSCQLHHLRGPEAGVSQKRARQAIQKQLTHAQSLGSQKVTQLGNSIKAAYRPLPRTFRLYH
ncbi:unnamed protein product [Haemonchus placei]|uniref:Oxidoreductase n=1 Tax=Haemonchus placei TaxID=6290 RepID=A0A0N4X0G1_HAEPC|nr:unnamed protein product [Haemonchus placei]